MRYARLPSVAAVFVFGWFAAGCVNDENGLAIVHFLALNAAANNCVADPAGTLLQSSGTLDVSIAAQTGVGFRVSPVVANNLSTVSTTASPVNTIFLTGFDVELHPDPADAAVASQLGAANRKFHVPVAGGTIAPSNGMPAMAASEAAATFEAINGDVSKLLLPAVAAGMRDPLPLTVRTRPIGTHSGVTINGGWVDFPVYLCNGCLVNDLGPCPLKMAAPAVCNPAQEVNTCCESGGSLLCGSSAPHM